MSERTSYPFQNDMRGRHKLPSDIVERAYEVYCAVHGEQKAMMEGNCRGGFGIGEIMVYLYAYPFPKEKWRQVVWDTLRKCEEAAKHDHQN